MTNKQVSSDEIELLRKKVELLEKEVASKEMSEGEKSVEGEPTDEEIYKKSEVLYQWKAPVRVFIRRDKRWFLIVGLITLLGVFFLVIFNKPLLIAALLSAVFLIYVLSTTPPVIIDHEITNKGIYTLKKLYKWKVLKAYWFVEIQGQKVLYVDADVQFVPRLIMLVGEGSAKKLNELLQEHIPYKYIEKQGRISKFLDGEYVEAEKVPGKRPATNRGEE